MIKKEDCLQISCVRWFEMQYPKYKMLLHHSPNGGYRNSIEAAKFKRMGTRAGFPDLILLLKSKGFAYLAIELKTEKGRQSENQKSMEKTMIENCGKYCVCRSLDDFIKTISEYI